MVLKPEPVFACVDTLGFAPRAERVADNSRQSVILLSAQGRRFDQKLAAELTTLDEIALICGRYEGVDERVNTALADREISIGDYVLSGGELGATVILDTVTRLLPGALGNEASSQQESFTAESTPNLSASGADSTCSSGGLLDYPHFTRPAEFRGIPIPEVLVTGDHEKIRRWRRRSALAKTLRNRPDLLNEATLGKEDRRLLDEIRYELQNDIGMAETPGIPFAKKP
jgi:tRNA (guanine37-N1)-methyltransferase